MKANNSVIQANFADLEARMLADVIQRHPELKIAQVHDDLLIDEDSLEQFMDVIREECA